MRKVMHSRVKGHTRSRVPRCKVNLKKLPCAEINALNLMKELKSLVQSTHSDVENKDNTYAKSRTSECGVELKVLHGLNELNVLTETPYEELDNILRIPEKPSGSIFSATWRDGIRIVEGDHDNPIRSRTRSCGVILETLNDSQLESLKSREPSYPVDLLTLPHSSASDFAKNVSCLLLVGRINVEVLIIIQI
ncbi:21405_t:CDS:2, partial [Racocetra persica]